MSEYSKKYSRYLLSDELWEEIHPIVLELCPRNKIGRKRMDDRKALNAIFYVLRSGIPWDALHPDLGASSTVHDRFMYFVRQGLFLRLWQLSLIKYDELKKIDWQFLAMDGCHTMAPIACEETGPSYKHRGKSGVNRSLLTDANGIPLALVVAPANRLDMHLAEATLQSFAIERPNPNTVEQHICLDKGYDCAQVEELLKEKKLIPHIRRRGTDYSDILIYTPDYKARRWVVERSHSWFNRFRRIILRWEKKSEHYLAFMHFACAIITYKRADIR